MEPVRQKLRNPYKLFFFTNRKTLDYLSQSLFLPFLCLKSHCTTWLLAFIQSKFIKLSLSDLLLFYTAWLQSRTSPRSRCYKFFLFSVIKKIISSIFVSQNSRDWSAGQVVISSVILVSILAQFLTASNFNFSIKIQTICCFPHFHYFDLSSKLMNSVHILFGTYNWWIISNIAMLPYTWPLIYTAFAFSLQLVSLILPFPTNVRWCAWCWCAPITI